MPKDIVVRAFDDVGVEFSDQNPCVGPDDPYCNTGGVPHAVNDTFSVNHAGMDLADGTTATIGFSGLGPLLL